MRAINGRSDFAERRDVTPAAYLEAPNLAKLSFPDYGVGVKQAATLPRYWWRKR